MQLCVNEIAQHKWVLTSGSSTGISVLCSFAPHGIRRRHQEKHPANIVPNQHTEQGVGTTGKGQRGSWDGLQEASLHYKHPDMLDRNSMCNMAWQRFDVKVRFRNSWVWFGVTASDSIEDSNLTWACSHNLSMAPALNYARSAHITTFIEEESIPVWLDFELPVGIYNF